MKLFRFSAAGFAFAAAPVLLYQWDAACWIQFLLYGVVVAGAAPAFLRRSLGPSFGLSACACSVPACIGFFAFIFAVLRFQGAEPVIAAGVAAAGGQVLTFLGMRRLLAATPAESTPWKRGELLTLFAVVLGVAIFMRGPFLGYGARHGESIGFSSLMITDVFHHIATAAEVAKGIPPENPYYAGEKLHYYWLPHVLPGSFHALTGKIYSLPHIVQMTCFLYALSLLTLLASALRLALGEIRAWAPPFIAGVFAYSFIWVMPVLPSLCRILSSFIPALRCEELFVEQGETYSGLSHGMLRDFVIEPHGDFALCLILALFVLRRLRNNRERGFGGAFFEGLVLGLCFGSDSFLGIAACLWWGALTTFDIASSRFCPKRMVLNGLALLGGFLAIVPFYFAVEMFIRQAGTIAVVPYTRMILLFPLVFVLEYGPLWIFAVLGGPALFRRENRAKHLDSLLLIAIVVPMMLLLRQGFVHNLVFRKLLRILKLPILVSMGLYTDRVLKDPARRRRSVLALTVLIMLALPSIVTDFRGLSESDGGGRSVLADLRDVRAYAWLREHTPEDAVIQGRPDYGDKSNFSPAVVFGERRSAAGDYIHTRNYQIGDGEAENRSVLLREKVFGGENTDEARTIIHDLGITHVYVGEVERSYFGKGVEKFENDPAHFRKIYSAEGIRVYEVRIVKEDS